MIIYAIKGGIWLGFYRRLDYWSIADGLDKIENGYHGTTYEKKSQYKEYYLDLITELANLAGEMYVELEHLVEQSIPYEILCNKNLYLDDGKKKWSSIIWFDAVTCILNDINMEVMLDNEGIFDYDDLAAEQNKRIRKLNQLTKRQQILLYEKVIGFVTRYMELQSSYETTMAVISELDYHHSFIVKKDGSLQAPGAAYL